jgi:hypothetical protein
MQLLIQLCCDIIYVSHILYFHACFNHLAELFLPRSTIMRTSFLVISAKGFPKELKREVLLEVASNVSIG